MLPLPADRRCRRRQRQRRVLVATARIAASATSRLSSAITRRPSHLAIAITGLAAAVATTSQLAAAAATARRSFGFAANAAYTTAITIATTASIHTTTITNAVTASCTITTAVRAAERQRLPPLALPPPRLDRGRGVPQRDGI